MLVGTWVHGFFVVGQAPFGVSTISNLPTMRGKRAAVFCTFALNPGNSLDKLTGAVQATGADVVGGLALSRSKLEQHSEIFASRSSAPSRRLIARASSVQTWCAACTVRDPDPVPCASARRGRSGAAPGS